MTGADLLCYGALAVNLLAMSMSSQTALRMLSLLANLLLASYAAIIGASALVIAANAVMTVHVFHLLRSRKLAEKAS